MGTFGGWLGYKLCKLSCLLTELLHQELSAVLSAVGVLDMIVNLVEGHSIGSSDPVHDLAEWLKEAVLYLKV